MKHFRILSNELIVEHPKSKSVGISKRAREIYTNAKFQSHNRFAQMHWSIYGRIHSKQVQVQMTEAAHCIAVTIRNCLRLVANWINLKIKFKIQIWLVNPNGSLWILKNWYSTNSVCMITKVLHIDRMLHTNRMANTISIIFENALINLRKKLEENEDLVRNS